MIAPELLVRDEGRVRSLVLNRPFVRNALSRVLVKALHAAMEEAEADDSVSVLLITGSDPAFCAGLDLKELAHFREDYLRIFEVTNCVSRVGESSKPVVGAVNGATFAGGLEIALGCDFLVASERAYFADTHAGVGVMPGGGMTVRLPPLVGKGAARRMSFTGEVIDARRAEQLGLVSEVVAHEELLTRAMQLAQKIAEVPLPTLVELKRMYEQSSGQSMRSALLAESRSARDWRTDFTEFAARSSAVVRSSRRQIGPG